MVIQRAFTYEGWAVEWAGWKQVTPGSAVLQGYWRATKGLVTKTSEVGVITATDPASVRNIEQGRLWIQLRDSLR